MAKIEDVIVDSAEYLDGLDEIEAKYPPGILAAPAESKATPDPPPRARARLA